MHLLMLCAKSVPRASIELRMPRSTVRKVLHKRLLLHAYKVQLLQELMPNDRPQSEISATEILTCIDEDNDYYDYLKHVFFMMKLPFIHVAMLTEITYPPGDRNTHMLRLNMNETAPK